MVSQQHACKSKLAYIAGPCTRPCTCVQMCVCVHVIKHAHGVPLFLFAFITLAYYVFLCILLSQCSGNIFSASFGDAAIGSMKNLLAELHSKHLLSNGGTFRPSQKVKGILSLIYLFIYFPFTLSQCVCFWQHDEAS